MSLNDVLNFWFGEIKESAAYTKSRRQLWFGKDPATDEQMRRDFGPLLTRGAAGELDSWVATPRGRLALILLLDQFSRNIYRGTAQSFAQDPKCLQITLEGLDGNVDQLLHPIERRFMYLPLEHSESLAIQKKSLHYFSQLVTQIPAPLKTDAEDNLTYAVRHFEIIERFGRFPHRNEILGRMSTPEEIEFLKGPNSSF